MNTISCISNNKKAKIVGDDNMERYLQIDYRKQPHIATYFIKPIVKVGEEVFIDYYITDYYYKEYNGLYDLKKDGIGDKKWVDEELYNCETFTVIVRVEGQEDKSYANLKAGDHQVSLGSFNTEGEVKFSILCIDKYGRSSHELFNYFLVQNDIVVNEYVMTEEDLTTYNIKNTDNYEVRNIVDLSSLETKNATTIKNALTQAAANIVPQSKTYVCVIADSDGDGKHNNWWGETQVVYASDYDKEAVLTEATNTKNGLQQLLDDKKAEGYNKLTLLPGTYRIDHQKQIYIPSNFTLDMNGSTLKLNQFTGNGCLMVDINHCINTHVVNGIIEGDYFSHDYANSPNNSEWCNGIQISGGCKYCSFENLTVKDITGYGSGNGIGDSRDGSLGYTYVYPKGIGNSFVMNRRINKYDGSVAYSDYESTCDFIDISSYANIDYLQISRYLGYQGNAYGVWNLQCHFYDKDKNYIKGVEAYQYRRIRIPSNSKYIRVTIPVLALPTDLSIQYFRVPTHCAFKNIKHENCRCVGMAQSAMNNMLVENCEFINCGQSSARCAYDAEDGWDQMQDVTFKSLKFNGNPNNDFLTCAGHNFIIDGQIGGAIHIWERTRAGVIKNCNVRSINVGGGGSSNINMHGVWRIHNNTFNGGDCIIGKNVAGDNIFINYIPKSGIFINSDITCSTDSCHMSSNVYIKCKIHFLNTTDNNSYTQYMKFPAIFYCCEFYGDTNPDIRHKLRILRDSNYTKVTNELAIFYSCKFYNKIELSEVRHATFINCYFEDLYVSYFVYIMALYDKVLFKNCNINYSTSLIRFGPFAYTKGSDVRLIFDDCNITKIGDSSNMMFDCYSKPNGVIKFINSNIDVGTKNYVLIDGWHSYYHNIDDLSVYFINTPIPDNVALLADAFEQHKSEMNIKFIQE